MDGWMDEWMDGRKTAAFRTWGKIFAFVLNRKLAVVH
jgi:hypothetical protein